LLEGTGMILFIISGITTAAGCQTSASCQEKLCKQLKGVGKQSTSEAERTNYPSARKPITKLDQHQRKAWCPTYKQI
jgi:hypothetical protein